MEISRRKVLLGRRRVRRGRRAGRGVAGRGTVAVDLEAVGLGGRGGRGRRPALGVGRAGRPAGRLAARPGRRAPGQRAAADLDLQLPAAAGRTPGRRAGLRRAGPPAAGVGRPRQAADRGRLLQEARALPRPPVRVRQRHDEHRHPQRGSRRLLLQGRRGHAGPHHQDRQARARHRRPERLPARRRHGGDRGQDPAWCTRPCGTCCRSRRTGPRSAGRSRSRSARPTSWSPGTAWPPSPWAS